MGKQGAKCGSVCMRVELCLESSGRGRVCACMRASCVYVRSGTVKARASPKSASFRVPRFGSTSTFCGLRSLSTGHGGGVGMPEARLHSTQLHSTQTLQGKKAAAQPAWPGSGAPVKDAVRVAPRQPIQHLVRKGLPGRGQGVEAPAASGLTEAGAFAQVLIPVWGESRTLMQFALSLYWHDFMYFFRS